MFGECLEECREKREELRRVAVCSLPGVTRPSFDAVDPTEVSFFKATLFLEPDALLFSACFLAESTFGVCYED